jgi:hypothetical protein
MIVLQDSIPYSTGEAESFFDGKSSTFSNQIKKVTDSEEKIICHNLNVEEIWKKRLIGAIYECLMIKTDLQKDTAPLSLLMSENGNNLPTATFTAGCFWCVEEKFRKVEGIKSTIVGYTGGGLTIPHTSTFAPIRQVTQKQPK